MALAGVHIAFGYCSVGSSGSQQDTLLPFNVTSSQTMASPATSSIRAPTGATSSSILLSISASAAIYYAVGPNPVADGTDSPNKRRYYDPQFGREDIFVTAGDKFAWALA